MFTLERWRRGIMVTCITTVVGVGTLSAIQFLAVPSVVSSAAYIHNNWPSGNTVGLKN